VRRCWGRAERSVVAAGLADDPANGGCDGWWVPSPHAIGQPRSPYVSTALPALVVTPSKSVSNRVAVHHGAVPAKIAAEGARDDVLPDRIDERTERVVGVGPESRPLLPELAADDDVGDAADRLAHQLTLLGPERIELEAVGRLDDAIDRGEEVSNGLAGHGECLSLPETRTLSRRRQPREVIGSATRS
jgi:hypothetical protein